MADKKILIVGASIAGPMAAFWLAKSGADITVVERHEAMRDGGQNVDIRTSGVTVVHKVPELEARIRAAAAPLEGMRTNVFQNDRTGRASNIKYQE